MQRDSEKKKQQTDRKQKIIILFVLLGTILLLLAAIVKTNMITGSENNKQPEGVDPALAEIGDIILFGMYEQDDKTSNGKEPIEWKVLEKEEDRILVISQVVLDGIPYHEEDKAVTWETCSIRNWLNNTFIQESFSIEEQNKIIVTDIQTSRNYNYLTDGGNDTQDKVFLLSIEEAQIYFMFDDDRKAGGSHYIWSIEELYKVNGNFCWWLRSPGNAENYAVSVNFNGRIDSKGSVVYSSMNGIRPAMWISIDS